jgi:hypothetical protein
VDGVENVARGKLEGSEIRFENSVEGQTLRTSQAVERRWWCAGVEVIRVHRKVGRL